MQEYNLKLTPAIPPRHQLSLLYSPHQTTLDNAGFPMTDKPLIDRNSNYFRKAELEEVNQGHMVTRDKYGIHLEFIHTDKDKDMGAGERSMQQRMCGKPRSTSHVQLESIWRRRSWRHHSLIDQRLKWNYICPSSAVRRFLISKRLIRRLHRVPLVFANHLSGDTRACSPRRNYCIESTAGVAEPDSGSQP